MRLGHLSRGFTIVELLIVIAMIGMLVSLLLPAINSARESGRRTTCVNNMRQLTQAIIDYEGVKKRFPGQPDGIQSRTSGNRFVWRPLIYFVLPHLGRNDLQKLNDGSRAQNGMAGGYRLEILLCPSDTPTLSEHTSFCYNMGLPDRRDKVANGVITQRWNGPSVTPGGGIGLAYVQDNDGAATTYLVSENVDLSATGVGYNLASSELDSGFLWHDLTDDRIGPPFTINGRKGERTGSTGTGFARPSSYHPGGVNAAFCDGSVRFVTEDIDYHVYAAHCTSKGVSAGPSYISGPSMVERVRGYLLGE